MHRSLLVFAFSLFFVAGCTGVPVQTVNTQQTTQQASRQTKASIQIMAPETSNTQETQTTMQNEPVYQDYTTELGAALINKKPVALFFMSESCTDCEAFDKTLTAGLKSLPAGTRILKVDSAAEAEFKKQYEFNDDPMVVVFDAKGVVVGTFQKPVFDDLKAMIEKSMSL